MSNSKESTRKYIVTQTNTLNHKVGDVIELTDTKAAALVNKVRLQDKPANVVVDVTNNETNNETNPEANEVEADTVGSDKPAKAKK